jgi:hypothetical protein
VTKTAPFYISKGNSKGKKNEGAVMLSSATLDQAGHFRFPAELVWCLDQLKVRSQMDPS